MSYYQHEWYQMRSTQQKLEPFKFMRSNLVRAGFGIALLALTLVAFAAELDVAPNSPDWLQIGLGLFGGLALFLSGLQLLSEGMKKAAGQTLTTVLSSLTTNRFMGSSYSRFTGKPSSRRMSKV